MYCYGLVSCFFVLGLLWMTGTSTYMGTTHNTPIGLFLYVALGLFWMTAAPLYWWLAAICWSVWNMMLPSLKAIGQLLQCKYKATKKLLVGYLIRYACKKGPLLPWQTVHGPTCARAALN